MVAGTNVGIRARRIGGRGSRIHSERALIAPLECHHRPTLWYLSIAVRATNMSSYGMLPSPPLTPNHPLVPVPCSAHDIRFYATLSCYGALNAPSPPSPKRAHLSYTLVPYFQRALVILLFD